MFHRKRSLATINTEKHIVNHPRFTVASGVIAEINVTEAVAVVNKNAPNEVEEGSLVKAVYLEYWMTSDATAQGSAVVTLEKLPAGGSDMSFTESQNLNTYLNKKNILNTFEGLIPPNLQNPVPILRGWYKIPKGKQRQGLGDKIQLNFANITNGMAVCGFDLYKEWK